MIEIKHSGKVYEFDDTVTPEGGIAYLYRTDPESFEGFDFEKLGPVLAAGEEAARRYIQAPTATKAGALSAVGVVDKVGGSVVQTGLLATEKITEGAGRVVKALANMFSGDPGGYTSVTQQQDNPATLTPQTPITAEHIGNIEKENKEFPDNALGKISTFAKETGEQLGPMNQEAARRYDVPTTYSPEKFSDLKDPRKFVVGLSSLASQISVTTGAGALGAVAGGAIAGPPGAALGGFLGSMYTGFSFEFQEGYDNAIAAGKSHEEATNDGLKRGVANGALESLVPMSLNKSLKIFKGKVIVDEGASKAKKLYAKVANGLLEGNSLPVTMIAEAATEDLQELSGAVVTGSKLPSLDDYLINATFGALGATGPHVAVNLPNYADNINAWRFNRKIAKNEIPANLQEDLKAAGEHQYLADFLNKDSITYTDLAEFIEGSKQRLAQRTGNAIDSYDGMYRMPELETGEDFDLSGENIEERAQQFKDTDPLLYEVLSKNKKKDGLFHKLVSGGQGNGWTLEQIYRTIYDISRGKSLDEDATLANGERVYKVTEEDRLLLFHNLWSGQNQLLHNLDMLAGSITGQDQAKALPYDMVQAMYDSTSGYRMWASKEEGERPGARKQAEQATLVAMQQVEAMLYNEARSAGFETTAELLAHKEASGNPLRVEQISAKVEEALSGRKKLNHSYLMSLALNGDVEKWGDGLAMAYDVRMIRPDGASVSVNMDYWTKPHQMQGMPIAYVKKGYVPDGKDPVKYFQGIPRSVPLEHLIILDSTGEISGTGEPSVMKNGVWMPMAPVLAATENLPNALKDESGLPAMFFHGTKRTFDTPADKGAIGFGARLRWGKFYLTADPKQASWYADRASDVEGVEVSPQSVKTFFVSPVKPLDLTNLSSQEAKGIIDYITEHYEPSDAANIEEFKKAYRELDFDSSEEAFVMAVETYLESDWETMNEVLETLGYDSIIHAMGVQNISILDFSIVQPSTSVSIAGQVQGLLGRAAREASLAQDRSGVKGTYTPPFSYSSQDASHQISLISGAANPTTLVHEFGHYLMHRLDPKSGTMQMIEEAVHKAIYKQHAGSHPVLRFKDWSYAPKQKKLATQHHEIAAGLFERYMFFREPPIGATPETVAAYAAMRAEFKRIYGVVSKIKNLNGDVKDFLDHVFNGGFDIQLRPEQALSAIEQVNNIFGGDPLDIEGQLDPRFHRDRSYPVSPGKQLIPYPGTDFVPDFTMVEATTSFRVGSLDVSVNFPNEQSRALYNFADMVKGASRKRRLEIANYVAEIAGLPYVARWNKEAPGLIKNVMAASKKYKRLLRVEAGKQAKAFPQGTDRKAKLERREAAKNGFEAPAFRDLLSTADAARLATGRTLKQENVKGTSIGKGTLPPYMIALLEDNDMFTGSPLPENSISFKLLEEVARKALGDRDYVNALLRKAKDSVGDGLTEMESAAIHLMFMNETARCAKFSDRDDRYAKQEWGNYKTGIFQLESLASKSAGRHLSFRAHLARNVNSAVDEVLKKKKDKLPRLVRQALRQIDENIYSVIDASGLAAAKDLKEAIAAIDKWPELKGWKKNVFEAIDVQLRNKDEEAVATMKATAVALRDGVVTKSLVESYLVGNLLSSVEGRLRDLKDNTLMLGYMAYGRKTAEAMVDFVGSKLSGKSRETYFREILVNPFTLKHKLPDGLVVSSFKQAKKRASEVLKGEVEVEDKSRAADFGAQYGMIPNLLMKYGNAREKAIARTVGTTTNVVRSIDTFTRVLARDVYAQQFQHKLEIWERNGELQSRLKGIADQYVEGKTFKTEKDRQDTIEAIMRDPSISLSDGMIDFMNMVTFQNESWLADSLRSYRDKVDRAIFATTGIPIPVFKYLSGSWFLRTGTNIIKNGLKITPIWADPTFGAATLGIPILEGSTRGKSTRDIVLDTITNQIVGHALALPIAFLYFTGKITGPPSEDDREKDYMEQEVGWKPYAFRFEFGDKVYYQTMPDSFAWGIKSIINRLSFIKNIDKFKDPVTGEFDNEAYRKMMFEVTVSANSSLLYNTYFRELSSASSSKFSEMPVSRLQGLLPFTGFIRWVSSSWKSFQGQPANYVDTAITAKDGPEEILMKTLGAGYGQHIANSLGRAIPGIEYQIPPKIGIFGKTIGRERAMYDLKLGKLPMEWFPIPIPFTSRATEGRKLDEVEMEWSRLGVYPDTISQEQTFKGGKWEMTIPETQHVNMEFGRMLKAELPKIINNNSYRSAPIEIQQKIMSRFVGKYKEVALAQLKKDKDVQQRMIKGYRDSLPR